LALGQSSLITNTSGSFNVAVGHSAGYLTTSGLSATGSNNSIFIGYDTRPQLNNQTNQIVIGHGATGSGSNSVTLGASTITKTQLRGTINIGNVPQYASNGAAISGGLVPGDIYQTLSNVLMVVI
jgi:curli biogenesis system outer membrane secretion channel CsgG